MKIQKKHVVSAALILALSAAVYVNWQFNSAGAAPSVKELGAASYVNASVKSATVDQSTKPASGKAKSDGFFASERIKRDETQDKVIDEAKEIFDLENADEKDISEAQKNVEQMLKNFTIQDSIETIIKAKGFSDCMCFISDSGVSVIVPADELNETAALVIDDAVTTHYEVSYEKISITGA